MKSWLEEELLFLSWFEGERTARGMRRLKVQERGSNCWSKGPKGAGEAVKAGQGWLWKKFRTHLISRTKERKKWVGDRGEKLGDKKLCWLHLLSDSGGEITC